MVLIKLTGCWAKENIQPRDHRFVFFNGKYVGVLWRQFKLLFVEYEKKSSLARPAYTGGSIPQLYNLRADPKEEYNVIGESGATNIAAHMLKMGAVPQASFQNFPHMDYTKMTRDK